MAINEVVTALLGELRMLSSSEAVVGKPIAAGDSTVIPVSTLKVGFGTGMANGKSSGDASRQGGTTGVGGGLSVDPQAFIVIGPDGSVQLLTIHDPVKGAVVHALDALPMVLDKVATVGEKLLTKGDDTKQLEE